MEGSGCGEVPCPSRSRSPPAWADYSRETIKMEDDEKEQMDHLGSRSTQCMDGAPEPVDLRGHQPPKAADLSNRQGEQRPRARGELLTPVAVQRVGAVTPDGRQRTRSRSGARAGVTMEVFPRVSLEAGRTLDDYYYAMTYEGITQEQLAIAVLCPHGEESEDEEEGQKEEPGQEGCDAGAKHQPSSSSRQHGDREGGNGPSQTHGTPEPRQPPATGHSSGKGAGVDVGTTAESRGGGEPHFSDSKGQIAPKYKDTAYGCVAVLVQQLRGTGDVVVPDDVDIAVVEAFRVALFWARMNEAGIRKAFSDAPHCRPVYRPDMDMHLIFPFFRDRLTGNSVGAAFLLGILQYMTGCKLIPRVGVTGRMTLHDGMHKVGGVSLKMRPVRRGILNKLVVPNQNRRERAVQAGVATGQVACMGSFHDLLRETVVGGSSLELKELEGDVARTTAMTFGDNVDEPFGLHFLELAVADGTGQVHVCGTDAHKLIASDIRSSRIWLAQEAHLIVELIQEFLPDARLCIDVGEMVRTPDHPRVQQGQASAATLDMMVHVMSWQRMDTKELSAALSVGMLALACGLQVPYETVVLGLASPRGVMMASTHVEHIDLKDLMGWGKTVVVMPLACLKLLLATAHSAEHEYVVLEEGPSEMRAVYAGQLKLVGVTLIHQALRDIFAPTPLPQEEKKRRRSRSRSSSSDSSRRRKGGNSQQHD